jgi:hypothetical protein
LRSNLALYGRVGDVRGEEILLHTVIIELQNKALRCVVSSRSAPLRHMQALEHQIALGCADLLAELGDERFTLWQPGGSVTNERRERTGRSFVETTFTISDAASELIGFDSAAAAGLFCLDLVGAGAAAINDAMADVSRYFTFPGVYFYARRASAMAISTVRK